MQRLAFTATVNKVAAEEVKLLSLQVACELELRTGLGLPVTESDRLALLSRLATDTQTFLQSSLQKELDKISSRAEQ
jgi:hypothetical protein